MMTHNLKLILPSFHQSTYKDTGLWLILSNTQLLTQTGDRIKRLRKHWVSHWSVDTSL